ncbi:MAG: hypothetical protein ACR2OY_01490, partial [Boseongicola sp.]
NERDQILKLALYGRFRLTDPSGVDLAPKSAKSQALLALLATSEARSRGRLWLQNKLWPNSDLERASVSLRQALSEIRRSLGDHRDVLAADRRSCSLQQDRISLTDKLAGQEFLEGIGLNDSDHALSDWLSRERVQVETPIAAPFRTVASQANRRPKIYFQTVGDGAQLKLIEDIFVDCVVRSLREALTVDVHVGGAQSVPEDAFRVHVQAYVVEGAQVGIRGRIYHGTADELVWAGMTSTQLHGAPPVEDLEIVSLGNQLIDALADALTLKVGEAQDIRDANLLIRMAVRRIFRMRPDALTEADAMLEQAHELAPCGLSAAWRAQLRVIQEVERHPGRSEDIPEQARELCGLAMELEPLNSMVLAAVANTRLVLDEDVSACNELARRSVSLNPSNPLAWDSLSTAKLYAGEIGEAHALAVRAQKISTGSPFGYWWDMGRCLTAALTGRGDEALKLAEAAHALSPEFRPPLRYLTALYAADDRPEAALRVAERLRRLEPDFSFDRIANDAEYPISPLRWSGLLDSDKLMALN